LKLLVVEDSSFVRKITKSAARLLGYEQLEATQIGQALYILNDRYIEIELIIFDWNLGQQGLDFVKLIRSDINFSKIPVIVTFTEIKKENVVKAKSMGVASFALKPFTVQEIVVHMLESIGK